MWARSTRIVAPRQHVGTSLRQRIHRGRRVDEARSRKGHGATEGLRPREGRRLGSLPRSGLVQRTRPTAPNELARAWHKRTRPAIQNEPRVRSPTHLGVPKGLGPTRIPNPFRPARAAFYERIAISLRDTRPHENGWMQCGRRRTRTNQSEPSYLISFMNEPILARQDRSLRTNWPFRPVRVRF